MNSICGQEKYKYSKKYIYIPINLPVEKLPQIISLDEGEFLRKTTFHISLLCTKNISSDLEENILKIFCKCISANNISHLSFKNEYRLVQRESDGRKSIIVMCNVSHLDIFIEAINRELGVDIEYPPTHVTLYTAGKDKGIGLHTKSNILEMTKEITSLIPTGIKDIFSSLKSLGT